MKGGGIVHAYNMGWWLLAVVEKKVAGALWVPGVMCHAEPEAKERSGFGVQTSQIWRKAQRGFFSDKGSDP